MERRLKLILIVFYIAVMLIVATALFAPSVIKNIKDNIIYNSEPAVPSDSFFLNSIVEKQDFKESDFKINKQIFRRGSSNNVFENLSDDIVYKYGYVSYDNYTWQKFELSSNLNDSDWISRKENETISIKNVKIAAKKNVRIALYSCKKGTLAWKCHNGKWQVEDIDASEYATCQAQDMCELDGECYEAGITINNARCLENLKWQGLGIIIEDKKSSSSGSSSSSSGGSSSSSNGGGGSSSKDTSPEAPVVEDEEKEIIMCTKSSENLCVQDTNVTACYSNFNRLEKLVDGDESTYDDSYNNCNENPEWWQFEFNETKKINHIEFKEKNFWDGWIAKYPLYYSEYLDNGEWIRVENIERSPENVEANFSGGSWNNLTFNEVETSAFRLIFYKNGSNTFTGLSEVRCFGNIEYDCTPVENETTSENLEEPEDPEESPVEPEEPESPEEPEEPAVCEAVVEICGDNIDQDCDGFDDVCPTCSDELHNGDETGVDCGGTCGACELDNDNDGYFESEDCDDNNDLIYPEALEICGDDIDQDCSGVDKICPVPSGQCLPGGSCTDRQWGCDENGVDCGGVCSTLCADTLGNPGNIVNYGRHTLAGETHSYPMAVYTPEEYKDDYTKKWPTIVFIHGLGMKYSDTASAISGDELHKLENNGPLSKVKNGENIPFIIIAPQSGGWSNHVTTRQAVEAAKKHYRVDENRLYVTGQSAGSPATFEYGMNFPEEVAAIAPIATRNKFTDASMCSLREHNVGVWSFHGDGDCCSYEEELVYLNYNCGYPVDNENYKYTLYDNTGHDSWSRTFHPTSSLYALDSRNMDIPNTPYGTSVEHLYDWFLKHKKN